MGTTSKIVNVIEVELTNGWSLACTSIDKLPEWMQQSIDEQFQDCEVSFNEEEIVSLNTKGYVLY
jgi:hypothetical protein